MCGAGGCWPCNGVRRRIASAGGTRRRSIRNWRAASAAVSSLRVRTRTARSVGWIGWPSPSRCLTPTARPTPLHVDGARAAVVVFTCNHCPYALAWHERIQAVARDYADRGVRVLQINANDAVRYPHDSLEAMKARVDAGEFAGAVPARRDPGGRARVGRQDDARRVRHRRDAASSTAARRTPITATRP